MHFETILCVRFFFFFLSAPITSQARFAATSLHLALTVNAPCLDGLQVMFQRK